MLDAIILFSIRQRLLVIFFTLGLAVFGIYNFRSLPIDAVPDITNVQVQINTRAPGYTPQEVEQRITFPLETSLSGLPRLTELRSLSRYGLSQITVVFEDSADIYFARQLVNSRLQESRGKLPEQIEPVLGPISTGLGEIFMWTVRSRSGDQSISTLMNLRLAQDWIIRPQLRTVPGVAEVNSVGGFVRQYHVTPDPEKLIAYGLSFQNILHALMRNNANIGAGYLEQSGEQFLIRSPGQAAGEDDIRHIVIGSFNGAPLYIQDTATVLLGRELRNGAATEDGQEVVLGTVFMLKGENSRAVAQRVAKKMEDIKRSLPEDIVVRTVYDRTKLISATLGTVRGNLLEGALLVIAVLFLLLGNFRAALITALIIPLSMLFAISGMAANKISGNLLSLGAIDFGLIVDGAVIIVENCSRRLAGEQHRLGRLLTHEERLDLTANAAREVARPSVIAASIIMIVYLPVLTLTGIEGKMFQPMAFTVLAALSGAMFFSITFIPAMVAQFVSGKAGEQENALMRAAKKIYGGVFRQAFRHRGKTVLLASALLALSLLLSGRIGSEFLPTLNEGDFAVHAMRIPGTSLSQAVSMQHLLEGKLRLIPEIDYAFSKIGTDEIASDPAPPNLADVFIIMKPRALWPDASKERAMLTREIEDRLREVPGSNYEFNQPIQMRFNELIAGVRSDVAVKIFGDDMDTLAHLGERVADTVARIPGAADVKAEQVAGLPVLTILPERGEMARLGLNVSDVQDVIAIAIGGKNAGVIYSGDRRFDLVVRLPDEVRANIEALKRIPVYLPGAALPRPGGNPGITGAQGNFLPLGALAEFKLTQGPNQISRENGKRRVVVTANVRGRDLGSFVRDSEQAIHRAITLPVGYWMSWGGQFEHYLSARERLWVVVPIALLLIFLILFAAFDSVKDSCLVFTGVPLALTGGIAALWLRGIPFSISAAIGFIALSGVAVLNGVVMISFIQKLREEGKGLDPAIAEGSIARLRPVLMTALVASLGFLPMAAAHGTGAEVQRPLATVVIGGVISSTLLTLIVLPALYRIFHHGDAGDSPPSTGR